MAYHTFEFLRKRRKDPKWRDAYHSALLKRIYAMVFVMLIVIAFIYIEKNDIDIMSHINSYIETLKKIFGI